MIAAHLLPMAWVHDFSPFVVRLSGDFGIRWYGLSYVGGFVIAWLLIRLLARRGFIPMRPERAADAILILGIGAVVGGRLGYIVFYQPSLLWTFDPGPPWWNALAITKGGMASHGGVIGSIVACFIVARTMTTGTHRVLRWTDVIAMAAPLGLGLGRLANFVNGELLGKITAPAGTAAPWWAIHYPKEVIERPGEVTDAQLEGLRQAALSEGVSSYSALVDRLQQGTAGVAEKMQPFLNARHPSQLYQALAEGLVVFVVVWWVARVPRRPGIVGSWFLISYGVGRIVTEVWRLPDSHLEVARILGLSRGQWLSVLMILAGAIAIAIISRSTMPKVGGWATSKPTEPAEPASD